MTFSVLGTDGAGAVGMAVASSSPAVAARCIHLRARVGGAASQNVTDPRLGDELLDALQNGLGAHSALDAVVRAHETIRHRQLAVIDVTGNGATFTGASALGTHHEQVGTRVVAAGNLLAGQATVEAMVAEFEGSAGELEQRLLTSLVAGLDAGGEAGTVHSAGLAVVRDVAWRETDLRVDWSEQPLADLQALLDRWLPQRADYVTRGLDPRVAPSYGVPGDE